MIRWIEFSPNSAICYLCVSGKTGDMDECNNPAIIEDVPRNKIELDLHLMIHPQHNQPWIVEMLKELQGVDISWEKGESGARKSRFLFYRIYKNGRLYGWQ